MLTHGGLTSDYAGLYILPNDRIYERVEAGSTGLGAHLRHCQAESQDCKGLFAKQLVCSGQSLAEREKVSDRRLALDRARTMMQPLSGLQEISDANPG